MKKKIIIVILFSVLLLLSCTNKKMVTDNKINVDCPGIRLLFLNKKIGNEYITDGKKYNLYEPSSKEANDKDYWGNRKIFFINNNLAVLVTKAKVKFFNLEKKKIVREVDCNSRLHKNIPHMLVTSANDKGDLFIFNWGVLAKYNYQKDKLKVIYENKDWTWQIANIVYSKSRHSLFLVKTDDTITFNVYEFSLKNNEMELKWQGFISDYVKEEKRIYFTHDKEIRYVSIDTWEEKILWEGKWPIADISVVNENFIWVLYANGNSAEKTRNMDLLIGRKAFAPISTQFSFDQADYYRVDFKISPKLKEKWKKKYIN